MTLIEPEVAAVRAPLVNWRVRAPIVPVIDNPAKLARPPASVFTVVTPPSVPPPVRIVAETDTTPETAFPDTSRTWTVGCWANAMAFCAVAEGGWTMTSCVAAPAVIVTALEFAVARPVLVNCSVRAPTVPAIDRPAKVARPFASLFTVAVPPSVPPPDAIAAVTDLIPGTALPKASRTWTVGCCPKTTPFAAVVEGCRTITSWVAAPGAPVAMKVTGFGVMPPGAAVAVSELGPATVPSVHEIAVAMPEALVVTAATGRTDPPPLATANVTETPETGLRLASRTSTAGAVLTAAPAVAVCPSPVLMDIWVGAPAVIVTPLEVAGVKAPPVNCSVLAPTVPVMDNPANVASPAALVLIVATPPNAPPPVRIAAVTDTTPDTAFPEASRTWTVGCCAKLAPLAADAEGCSTIVNWVAAPAVMLTAEEAIGVKPPLVNCSVRDPTVPVTGRLVKVARPAALVLTVVVPPSVPPPDRIAAVTDTVPDTGFPEASSTCTVGCCANATPLADEADGC